MTEYSLGIERKEGETWRECAARIGRQHGLESEVLYFYDEDIKAGVPEDKAAWGACLEWDVCDMYVDGKRVEPK
jgi:hypothetical protein